MPNRSHYLFATLFVFAVTLTTTAWANPRANAEDHFKQGVEFVEKGQYIRAIAKLEQAIGLNPEWRYYEPLAQAYEAQNEVDKAFDAYDKFLKKAGNKLPVARRNEVRKIMDALQVRKDQQANQAEAQMRYQKGAKLQQEGRLELAIIEFEAAYDLSGEYFIKRNIAAIELALGNKARALSEFQKYLQMGKDKVSQQDRAAVEAQIRQLQKELKAEESLKGAKDDIKKARAYINRSDFEGAYKLLEKSYKIYQYYDTLQYMGKASAERKHYRRAIYFYNGFLAMGGQQIPAATVQSIQAEVTRLMPFAQDEERRDQAAMLAEKGKGQMAQRDHSGAMLSFEQAYRFSPSYPYLKLIAEAAEALDHPGKALSHYERYLTDGDNNLSAAEKETIRKLIAALQAKLEDRNSEAVAKEHFEQGMAAYNAKNYEVAVTHFEAAYNNASNHFFLNWYAESEAGLGNYEKALALYQLYLEEGSEKLKPTTRARTERRMEQLKQKIQSVQIADVPKDMETQLSDLIALGPAGQGAQMNDDVTPEPMSPVGSSPQVKKRVWTWVALGVTLAATATAATTGGLAKYKRNEIENKCPNNKCPIEYMDGALKWEQQANNLVLVRNISIGVGAAAFTSFVVLAIVEPKIWAKKELALTPNLGTGYAGLSFQRSF
ncbi:MAG: hypothetical protein M0R76_04035 [Proteobacteria bacterium]|nr:hypothetical protein [Pseudomonadota bacterium]